MTKQEAIIKSKTFPQVVRDAFTKYQDYADTLRYDRYENPQGKNAHCTRLFNKFYDICIRNGVAVDAACSVLGFARD